MGKIDVKSLLFTFLKKDLQDAGSYKAQILGSVISISFLLTILFYFSYQFDLEGLIDARRKSFIFLLSGLTLFEFSFKLSSAVGANILNLTKQGIFEELMQSKNNFQIMMISSCGYVCLFAYLRLFLYYFIGFLFFDFNFPTYESFFWFILVIFLSTATFLGISLIGGAFVLVIKRPTLFNTLFTYTSFIFGSVFFSSSLLPDEISFFSSVTPIYHVLEITRFLFEGNGNLDGFHGLLLNIVVVAIMSLFFGVVLLRKSINFAKKRASYFVY